MGGEARHQTAHVSVLAYPLSDELNAANALKKPGIKQGDLINQRTGAEVHISETAVQSQLVMAAILNNARVLSDQIMVQDSGLCRSAWRTMLPEKERGATNQTRGRLKNTPERQESKH